MTEDTQPQEGAGAHRLRAEDAIRFAMNILAETAWVQLGIQADPGTNEVQMDLPEAKLAIDAISALIPLLEGRASAHEMRDLRTLLSNLQWNYVERVNQG